MPKKRCVSRGHIRNKSLPKRDGWKITYFLADKLCFKNENGWERKVSVQCPENERAQTPSNVSFSLVRRILRKTLSRVYHFPSLQKESDKAIFLPNQCSCTTIWKKHFFLMIHRPPPLWRTFTTTLLILLREMHSTYLRPAFTSTQYAASFPVLHL